MNIEVVCISKAKWEVHSSTCMDAIGNTPVPAHFVGYYVVAILSSDYNSDQDKHT